MKDSRLWRTVFEKNPGFVSREVAGEHILIPVRRKASEADSLFTTNTTGSFVWNLIDGIRTAGGIRDELAAEFKVEAEGAGRDLAEFLEQLIAAGAIREA